MHRLAVLSSACVALVAALPNGVGLLPEYVRKPRVAIVEDLRVDHSAAADPRANLTTGWV